MIQIDPILLKIDKLISLSRLKEIASIIDTDITTRISKIATVLKQLRPGGYLLGTGPSTSIIIPLTVEEVVIGRSATVLEEPAELVIDYEVSDTPYFVPREVSRTHVKILKHISDAGTEYAIVDLNSTCGTYVNGSRIDTDLEGTTLSHGDVISLGPSLISTYVFYRRENHMI